MRCRPGSTAAPLVLDGRADPVRISTRAWPDTARRDIVDELPMWGIVTPWDPPVSRRAERDQRRAEIIERRVREEAAARHRRGGPR